MQWIPDTKPNEVSSYRPISLLSMLSKLLENIFLKRLQLIINAKDIIPSHQFGFRASHSTTNQVHRITNSIEEAKYALHYFQMSRRHSTKWHQGLMYKLSMLLPGSRCNFLCSYLSHRYFKVQVKYEYAQLKAIHAGVLQGSVLGQKKQERDLNLLTAKDELTRPSKTFSCCVRRDNSSRKAKTYEEM